MTTAIELVDETAYVLLTASDALVQNNSAYNVRVIFHTSLPAVDATAFHIVPPGQAIIKTSGVPAGNIYARCDKAATAKVSYSV